MRLYKRNRQRIVGRFEIYDALLQIAKIVYTRLPRLLAEESYHSNTVSHLQNGELVHFLVRTSGYHGLQGPKLLVHL